MSRGMSESPPTPARPMADGRSRDATQLSRTGPQAFAARLSRRCRKVASDGMAPPQSLARRASARLRATPAKSVTPVVISPTMQRTMSEVLNWAWAAAGSRVSHCRMAGLSMTTSLVSGRIRK